MGERKSIKTPEGLVFFPPNYVEAREGYHISYNPSYADYGIDTTALVIYLKEDKAPHFEFNTKEFWSCGVFWGDNFFILCGNHSKQLEACHSLDECIQYFIDNIDKAHECSQDINKFLNYYRN